jgi:hypothetical protein
MRSVLLQQMLDIIANAKFGNFDRDAALSTMLTLQIIDDAITDVYEHNKDERFRDILEECK